MERVTAGVLAAVMAVGMTGCANGGMSGTTTDLTGKYGNKEDGQTEGTGANGQTEDAGTEDAAMEEKDLGAIREAFEDSYTQFSLNLLRESRKQVQNGESAKNTMVCPLSVMMALEMTRTGADGDTKEQMGEVLYPGMSAEDGSMVLGRICKSLPVQRASFPCVLHRLRICLSVPMDLVSFRGSSTSCVRVCRARYP